MATTLREVFARQFKVAITPAFAKQMTQYCLAFEVRGTHAQALNSPYLGVHPIYFLPQDRDFLFSNCGCTEAEVKNAIAACPSINRDFRVASDAYNLFTIWVAYLTLTSTLSDKMKGELLYVLFKLLHYKFFTSLVRHNYPHPANEYVMQQTLESLSGKFDIKKPETSTWKLLIEKRCLKLIDRRESVYYETIHRFGVDVQLMYMIGAMQTWLRNQIKRINRVYYQFVKEKSQIGSYGLSTEVDDGQIIRSVDAMFDQMFSELVAQAPNTAKLIDNADLNLVCKLTNTPRLDLARTMFTKFCDTAAQQNRTNKQDLEVVENKRTYYVGYRALLRHLLQDTYAALATANGLDFRNRAGILQSVMNLYRSSRTGDQRILVVKDSVERMLAGFNITRREATLSFLKINFILYIILRSFRAL